MSKSTKGLLITIVALGFGIRFWMTQTNLGTLDSDMSVLGLMASEVRHGHFSIFHWGQAYAGAQETYIAGLLGLPFGVNRFVLDLTTILLSAVAAVGLGLFAKELFNRSVGLIAGSLFWLWPAPLVWWSLKIGSDYWYSLVVGVFTCWLVTTMSKRQPSSLQFVLLGLLLGQCFWSNPQSAYLVVPTLIRFWKVFRLGGFLLVRTAFAFLVSASPWIYFNLRYSFASLDLTGGARGRYSYAVENVFGSLLPMLFGFRVPYTGEWQLGFLGIALSIAFAILVIGGALRLRGSLLFPFVAFVFGIAIFLTVPFARASNGTRYLLWLFPWLILIIAVLVDRYSKNLNQRTAKLSALTAVIAVVSVSQLAAMNTSPLIRQVGPDVAVPYDDSALLSLLRDNDVHYAFADYWLAYRTTFETERDVLVAPYYVDRHPSITNAVLASPKPPHIFLTKSVTLKRFLGYCRIQTVSCPIKNRGAYSVVFPDRLIGPDEIQDLVHYSTVTVPKTWPGGAYPDRD